MNFESNYSKIIPDVFILITHIVREKFGISIILTYII